MKKEELNKIIGEIKSNLESVYDQNESKSITDMVLSHYLSIEPIDLIVKDNFDTSQDQIEQLHDAISKILTGVPVQHVIGQMYFYGANYVVNRHVLIPRPETEELIDLCKNDFKDIDHLNVIDLCTGSGCIAISLYHNLHFANVIATDISSEALDVAIQNQNNLGSKVEFQKADIFDYSTEEKFDIIVSNPPYVLESEKKLMHQNVLEHEPEIALFVDDHEPLIFYEKILEFSKKSLKENGKVYLEINEAFGQETKQLFQQHYNHVEVLKDLSNRDRFVIAFNDYS